MSQQLPAWLQAKVDQRIALIDETLTPAALAAVGQPPLIVTLLSEAPEGSTDLAISRWDRTCDACGKYCPYPRENFYTGQVQRTINGGVLVILFYGVCEEHRHAG